MSDIERPGPIDRTPETPGSGKNLWNGLNMEVVKKRSFYGQADRKWRPLFWRLSFKECGKTKNRCQNQLLEHKIKSDLMIWWLKQFWQYWLTHGVKPILYGICYSAHSLYSDKNVIVLVVKALFINIWYLMAKLTLILSYSSDRFLWKLFQHRHYIVSLHILYRGPVWKGSLACHLIV